MKSYQKFWGNWWNTQCRSDGATHFAALLQSEIWFLSKHLQAGLLSGFLELHLLRYIREGIANFFKSSVSPKEMFVCAVHVLIRLDFVATDRFRKSKVGKLYKKGTENKCDANSRHSNFNLDVQVFFHSLFLNYNCKEGSVLWTVKGQNCFRIVLNPKYKLSVFSSKTKTNNGNHEKNG